ncbi:glutamate receptor 2.8-like [Phragmites australis]|uniref:glutamate receptor 2.8-like n=1 Tax=Phragmites australis TaxID=29695 RepID=UPI002D778502|nr:glutamate receptor 2.8-like [Phragmites australis]
MQIDPVRIMVPLTSDIRQGSGTISYVELHNSRVETEMASRTIIIFLLLFFNITAAQNATETGPGTLNVGVILNLQSLVGKTAHTSILMAMEDLYSVHSSYRTKLVLHVRDSSGDDIQAASAAVDLLENYNAQAIIGPQKSSEAIFVSYLGNKSRVPVISFTATSPTLSSDNVPYFLRATLNDVAQVNCIAALIKAYGWREVVPIYEDTDYGRGIIPYLADALQEFGASMPYRSAISELANNDQVEHELYKLMTMQTRVYIVHMSSATASVLFMKAKELGMMSEMYAWILTDGIANIASSLNPSILEAMNGALGVRFYVPESKELDDFTARWNKRFKQDNPNDPPSQLSIFGLWSYDTIWALAQAADKVSMANATFQKQRHMKNLTCFGTLGISTIGPKLLEAILHNKFRGRSGDFDLENRQLQSSIFQIINVVGRGSKQIGFWTAKHGIIRQLDQNGSKTIHLNSMPDLNSVTWPGEVYRVPKGWQIPTNGKKLRVGVRISGYPEFMKVERDPITNATTATGYAIDVFEEVLKQLPYAVPYEYVAFDNEGVKSGSYNDFVYQVHLGIYDAAIGDITIRYNRTSYADFTLPYTESGVAMIVPVKNDKNKNTWVFLKPLTTDLWFGSIAFFIYTGIVIWLLERRINNAELTGSFFRQLGIAIYFSFFADRERVDSILSRLVVIVWVFVLLVITSSYTANLSSILTVQQLQPTVTDVHELLRKGEYVGYHKGSYVRDLLEALGFDRRNIRAYETSDDFIDALSKGSKNGGISAVIHEVPYIKIFLADHCKGYTMVGPIYKSEGFGFAFPKRSPMVNDFSRAILSITEGDAIIQIEKKWIGDQHACENDGTIASSSSLNFKSFSGLFVVTGIASTSALLIALVMLLYKNKHKIRNSIGSDQIRRGCGLRHINERNQESTIDSNQIQNMQLTVPNSEDDTCQQEIELSTEFTSSGSEVQTSQEFASHGTTSSGLQRNDKSA